MSILGPEMRLNVLSTQQDKIFNIEFNQIAVSVRLEARICLSS